MRTRKASFYLFTAAIVLVPAAAAITACGDDDSVGRGPVTLFDGGTSSGRVDGQVVTDSGNKTDGTTPTDSGDKDVQATEGGADGGPDADASSSKDADAASSPDADASSNKDADADAATKPTSVDNATYKITAWTCNGTKDVLAFATGVGIGEIDLTIAASSKLDILFSGGDCVRSNAVGVSYPEAGKITTTSNAADTCSGTCTTGQCDPGKVEPVFVDTFDFTKTSTSFTATRAFPTGRETTLAGQAGCAQGETESVTYTKK